MEIAVEIRNRDPHAVIVFVTTHSEFMPVSFQYQVSALDFIDKELPEELFSHRIEKAILLKNRLIFPRFLSEVFLQKEIIGELVYQMSGRY